MIVIGIVAIAISFILFPIVLDGAQAILTDAHIADYTGLEAVVTISPLLVFVALLFGGGLLTFKGVQGARKSSKKKL
jgi:predicted PurR-regulated permease PerM